jgi:hypothetical protein
MSAAFFQIDLPKSISFEVVGQPDHLHGTPAPAELEETSTMADVSSV